MTLPALPASLAAITLLAIGEVSAQPTGPVTRSLGPITATVTAPLRSATQVRALSDGRVLVHDSRDRRIVLFDPSMANPKVVFDSAVGRANSYGARGGSMFAYLGDTTVFWDTASQTFIVLDPAGSIMRTIASPVAAAGRAGGPGTTSPPPTGVGADNPRLAVEARAIAVGVTGTINPASTVYGAAGFDARGRLVYAAADPSRTMVAYAGIVPGTIVDDSLRILALDLPTRRVDTLAAIRRSAGVVTTTTRIIGGQPTTMFGNVPTLQPTIDEWVVLPNGSVAVLRGRDLHVDLIAPDGSRTSLPRIPFPWKRLTDDDRHRMLDSINTARKADWDGIAARRAADSIARARGAVLPPREAGDEPLAPFRPNTLEEIPDYLPPFGRAALRADGDGNLWIRQLPGPAVPVGRIVYDIVNPQGQLTDRVMLGEGQTLVGFAPGGHVFVSMTDAGVVKLLRLRFR